MTTKVIFKKFPEGDVIAIFPELPGTNNPYLTCLTYMNVGQHSSASIEFCGKLKAAKPNEYLPLYSELIRLGYDDLEIVKKFSRKMLQSRINQTL